MAENWLAGEADQKLKKTKLRINHKKPTYSVENLTIYNDNNILRQELETLSKKNSRLTALHKECNKEKDEEFTGSSLLEKERDYA